MVGNPGQDPHCRCGHSRSAHRHYRGGSECALCLDCPRYRPARGLAMTLATRLLRRPAADPPPPPTPPCG